MKYVLEFTHDAIRENRSLGVQDESRKTPDFLTKLVQLNQEDSQRYTELHIFTGCAANVAAGSDTTSITINSILFHLLKEPKTFQKLRAEIDVAAEGKLGPITFEEGQKMPYLQAVIKEGLRIHSPTGLPMWRAVPPGGSTIAGKFFKPGVGYALESYGCICSSRGVVSCKTY